jgi:hypothetical protein
VEQDKLAVDMVLLFQGISPKQAGDTAEFARVEGRKLAVGVGHHKTVVLGREARRKRQVGINK